MKPLFVLAILLTLSVHAAHAEKDAALQPVLAKPGKATAEDAFTAGELSKPWAVAKGTWQIKDGALSGAFKEEDHHPAVLTLGVPNHDSIIKFSFKFDGNKGFNLSYNSSNGHLFRIVITGDGMTVVKDRDKKDKKSRTAELAKAEGKVSPGEWHTLLVEVQGSKVHVQLDSTLKASAENSELDVDKTGYRFVTGSSVQLDDLKTWAVDTAK